MNFLIAAIINRWLAPQRELSCSWFLWRKLSARLRERGRGESRESGAFLLGYTEPDGPARIIDFVLYDDLDPHSLDTGIVRFDGTYFGRLWADFVAEVGRIWRAFCRSTPSERCRRLILPLTRWVRHLTRQRN